MWWVGVMRSNLNRALAERACQFVIDCGVQSAGAEWQYEPGHTHPRRQQGHQGPHLAQSWTVQRDASWTISVWR